MSQALVEIRGTLQADGTLALDERPNLPAGRVKVIVESLEPAPPRPDPWSVLEQIWADRKARGMQPRIVEEIDAELNAMRDEWEEHQLALERIQDDARCAREGR